MQRYYYRYRADVPIDEAIWYANDYDPTKAENLRPDTEVNYFKPPNRSGSYHYINRQPPQPLRQAYVKGMLHESERVIAKGQEILEAMEKLLVPADVSSMIGILEEGRSLRVARSGYEPKPRFERLLHDLEQVDGEIRTFVSAAPRKTPAHGPHRLTCAAPKLVASVDTAALLPHMTEIWYDPQGQGVTVDGVRYHHRQRVPSCDHCEHNLRLIVFDEMRKRLMREVGQSTTRTAPAASTDQVLDRNRPLAKPFAEGVAAAASSLGPVSHTLTAATAGPAMRMKELHEEVLRTVRGIAEPRLLRTKLVGLLAAMHEVVKAHKHALFDPVEPENPVQSGDGSSEKPDSADEHWISYGALRAQWEQRRYPAIEEALSRAEKALAHRV